MKIKIELNTPTYVLLGAMVLLSILSHYLVGCSFGLILLFLVIFSGIAILKVEYKEDKEFIPWIVAAVSLIMGAVLSTYSIQYLLLSSEDYAKTSDEKMFLNILCCLAFYLLIYLCANRTGLSCIISNIFLLLFGFVDYFVYQFRGNEVTYADFRAATTGLSVASQYNFSLSGKCITVIMGCILYIFLVYKFTTKIKARWQMSIVNILLIALCVIWVILEAAGTNTETWEMKGTYKNGYVLNFVLGIRDSFVKAPEGYSASEISNMESQYEEKSSAYSKSETEKPTIITIMSESYCDLSVIGECETNVECTPFFDSLTENTTKGYALASVYGAKTPNSEWEYLSGNSMAFLPDGSVVYQQYINKTPTTLVSTLKNEGYTTVAMHPYYATGWSRNTVYPKMGFDEMHFIDDFDQTNIFREYIKDQELFDGIIDRFEKKQDGENLFMLGVTMQNHGGYTTSYDNFSENVYKIGTSYTDANQYLSLIHESDKALENLITYFENVDEPVEIVFFGDHQPGLYSKFYELLNGKGLNGLTMEELEALYTVPFFIWTNYESEEETIDITSLNYLSTLTLEKANIDLPAYNQYLADMMDVVPAINSRGYYSKSAGTYKHLDEATGDEKAWISKYNLLEYNSMFDKKKRSSLFFPYLEGDN